MTLHRLTGEGGELLSAQLQRVAEQQQDIDFGADMMDFDPIEGDPQQPRPLLVLTPPKAVSRKRVLPTIKPDARIGAERRGVETTAHGSVVHGGEAAASAAGGRERNGCV